jgi:hypothetical protein
LISRLPTTSAIEPARSRQDPRVNLMFCQSIDLETGEGPYDIPVD